MTFYHLHQILIHFEVKFAFLLDFISRRLIDDEIEILYETYSD